MVPLEIDDGSPWRPSPDLWAAPHNDPLGRREVAIGCRRRYTSTRLETQRGPCDSSDAVGRAPCYAVVSHGRVGDFRPLEKWED